DSEKETLSKEKDKIENEYKNENEGLNGKLQKELNDVYSIKKQLKLQEQELQNTINEEKTKLQDYKAQELAALDESKKALVNSIEELDDERKNLVVENERLSGEISFKEKKIKELEANIEDKIIDSDLKDIFVNHFEENITSKELNDQLSMLSLDEKDMVNNDEAVYYYGYSEKKSHINSQIKQILRSF
ncbi:hypothetical protein, partial [Staphylococcus haemolyticus]|uniref:hypothetical protein n=1 Tax=Staphylococcus haemolyticus TaxID=1283 RepID=UPI001C5CBD4E